MASDQHIKQTLLRPDELDLTIVRHDDTEQYGKFFIPGGATSKYGRLTFGRCDCNRELDSKGFCYFCDR